MPHELQVYSWEPVVCHDAVDMGWSTLGDLCIQDGKLLGGSYYQNFVGVWVTDISVIPFTLMKCYQLVISSLYHTILNVHLQVKKSDYSYALSFFSLFLLIQLIEPYRESSQPEPNSNCEQRQNFQETSLQKVGSFRRSTSTSSLRCISPDNDTKEIKNIYVDSKYLSCPFRYKFKT